jgi:protein SCO1
MHRFSIFFLAAMSLVLLAVFAVRPASDSILGLPRVVEGDAGSLLRPAKALPEFELTDNNGNSFANAQLRGKWTLLFMGFTSCGHLCPPTMYKLGLIKDELNSEFAAQNYAPVEVLFVSVDPGRDSIPVLDAYIEAYGEGFNAIGGEQSQIDILVSGLGATSRVLIEPDSNIVEHSPAVYLLDPEGRFASLFTPPLRVEPIAADVRKLAAEP